MVTATGSIRASGAHAAPTPTRPKTIRPQPDAHKTSPCPRAFSSASLMHLCSGKRCNIAPALTIIVVDAMEGVRTWTGARSLARQELFEGFPFGRPRHISFIAVGFAAAKRIPLPPVEGD